MVDGGSEQTSIQLGEDHPDHPGWREWKLTDPTRFNGIVLGLLLARADDERHARLRMFPQHHHTNLADAVHGGVIMSLIDVAMFAGATIILGQNFGFGRTVELTNHFVGAGDRHRPLDAVVEVVRETGRLIFTRGLVVQEEDTVSSFSGIIRKPFSQ